MPETLAAHEAEAETSGVMATPDAKVEKKDEIVASTVKNLMEILNPDGPYRWGVSSKKHEVGDEGYDYYVCRTSVYIGLLYSFRVIIDRGLLPREQESALSDALADLEAIRRKSGLRTEEDMKILRDKFTEALMALIPVLE